MSKRLTDAEKDQRITELEELLEQADRHLAETVAEREGLRRAWKVDYELVPVLRAQLASATATIAEQTQRADAAEGEAAGLRSALERAVFDCNCTGGYWDHMMSDGRVYTVTCKRCGPMRAALATPANGAGDVLKAAVSLYEADLKAQEAETNDEHILGHRKYDKAIRTLFSKVRAWQKREGDTECTQSVTAS